MKKIILVSLLITGCASLYGVDSEIYKQRKPQYDEVCKDLDICSGLFKGGIFSFDAFNDSLDKGYSLKTIKTTLNKRQETCGTDYKNCTWTEEKFFKETQKQEKEDEYNATQHQDRKPIYNEICKGIDIKDCITFREFNIYIDDDGYSMNIIQDRRRIYDEIKNSKRAEYFPFRDLNIFIDQGYSVDTIQKEFKKSGVGYNGYWNFKDTMNNSIRKEEIELKKQKLELEMKEEIERKNKISKKYGNKEFCSYGNLSEPNCLIETSNDMFSFLPDFTSVQQTNEGTLVKDGDGPMIFIEKNSIDKNIVDGRKLKAGIFENTGIYSYTNVLGSTTTIYKLKRLQ